MEVAPMQINVVLNGAEVLASMSEPIQKIVAHEINKALNKLL